VTVAVVITLSNRRAMHGNSLTNNALDGAFALLDGAFTFIDHVTIGLKVVVTSHAENFSNLSGCRDLHGLARNAVVLMFPIMLLNCCSWSQVSSC
jgi:hypothetical protein